MNDKPPVAQARTSESKSVEKRRSRRTKLAHQVRVRPSDPKDTHFEDIPTSVNVSREGIYFLTKNMQYYVGMRLFVTFPYTSAHDPMSSEYVAQVTRVENLGSHKVGVAIELLSTMNIKGPNSL